MSRVLPILNKLDGSSIEASLLEGYYRVNYFSRTGGDRWIPYHLEDLDIVGAHYCPRVQQIFYFVYCKAENQFYCLPERELTVIPPMHVKFANRFQSRPF